jgi:hypothetical protein
MLIAFYAVVFLAGAASVAIWLDYRFPRLAPSHLKVALVHLFVACVANQLLDDSIGSRVAASSVPHSRLVAAVGVIFPLLVYAALAGFWTIRLAQRAMGHLR